MNRTEQSRASNVVVLLQKIDRNLKPLVIFRKTHFLVRGKKELMAVKFPSPCSSYNCETNKAGSATSLFLCPLSNNYQKKIIKKQSERCVPCLLLKGLCFKRNVCLIFHFSPAGNLRNRGGKIKKKKTERKRERSWDRSTPPPPKWGTATTSAVSLSPGSSPSPGRTITSTFSRTI